MTSPEAAHGRFWEIGLWGDGEFPSCPVAAHETSVIFMACEPIGILFVAILNCPKFPVMRSLMDIFSPISLRWWVTLIISVLGITAICLRLLERDAVRAKRAERNKKKELLSLAGKISSYGRTVHQRYPTGDVIVSERDLAEQLRKRPDAIVTALNVLLNEQKVQRAPLSGYWKLNV
jgi:hypothetical protein